MLAYYYNFLLEFLIFRSSLLPPFCFRLCIDARQKRSQNLIELGSQGNALTVQTTLSSASLSLSSAIFVQTKYCLCFGKPSHFPPLLLLSKRVFRQKRPPQILGYLFPSTVLLSFFHLYQKALLPPFPIDAVTIVYVIKNLIGVIHKPIFGNQY